MPHEPEKNNGNEQAIEVRMFRPDDAEGVVRLFQAVYEDHYPIKLFYDAKALTEVNLNGDNYTFLARTDEGEIVGVMNLFRSAPNKSIYELGAGLVRRDFRSLGISKKIIEFLFEVWLPHNKRIEMVYGEAVCNHTKMQKAVADNKHIESALEIALMPAEAFSRERSSRGRVAVVFASRCYQSRPHRVYLPLCYREELEFIYSPADDIRELVWTETEADLPGTSVTQMTVFDFAQVARIAVGQIGKDFRSCLEDLENSALAKGVVVFQVWLPLAVPGVSYALNIMRPKGYFLGGTLPRWFNEDALLMQKIIVDPCFEDITLYSDRAKKILSMVHKDWQRTQAGDA